MLFNSSIKLVAGNSNRPLAQGIGDYLKVPLTRCSVRRFADKEIFVEIQENVRGEDVFVVQSTSFPANDNLMELLDHDRRAAARLGAAHHRGDPLFRLCPAGPAHLRPHADLGQAGRQPDHPRRRRPGADRSTSTPARSRASSTSRPTICSRAPVIVRDIKERLGNGEKVVVSPDVGGVVRARALAKRIDALPRHRRQAPRARRRIRGDEHHRRRRRALLHPRRRHRRFRRHAVQRRRRAPRARARRTSTPTSPTACSPAARSRASRPRS